MSRRGRDHGYSYDRRSYGSGGQDPYGKSRSYDQGYLAPGGGYGRPRDDYTGRRSSRRSANEEQGRCSFNFNPFGRFRAPPNSNVPYTLPLERERQPYGYNLNRGLSPMRSGLRPPPSSPLRQSYRYPDDGIRVGSRTRGGDNYARSPSHDRPRPGRLSRFESRYVDPVRRRFDDWGFGRTYDAERFMPRSGYGAAYSQGYGGDVRGRDPRARPARDQSFDSYHTSDILEIRGQGISGRRRR